MSNDKRKVVVVGMGKRGKHHASAFQENGNFDVAGICDIDQSRLDDAAAMLGNDPVKSTDAAALLAEVKPEVFCFCTMPHMREDFIRMAIDNGVKLIAFEKPIATNSAAAARIRQMVEASGVKVVVSHQHRYGVHYSKVNEIAKSGALGQVHTIYASATGWMMHMMSHMIDYMGWYNGSLDADWAMAQAAGRGKLTDNHPSPDYIGGFIQFANGVRGVVEVGAGAPDIPEVGKWWGRNRIRVQGSDGFAEVLTNGGWRSVTKDGAASGEGAMDYAHDMQPYIQEMHDWLEDDASVHQCNFENAYKGFEIMMALCQSVVERGQIALPLERYCDELAELGAALPEKKVILGSPEHAAEYGD
jgi:predicted dehydrogenase